MCIKIISYLSKNSKGTDYKKKKKKSFTIKLRLYLPEFPVSTPEAEAGGSMDYKVRWSQKPKHHLGQV